MFIFSLIDSDEEMKKKFFAAVSSGVAEAGIKQNDVIVMCRSYYNGKMRRENICAYGFGTDQESMKTALNFFPPKTAVYFVHEATVFNLKKEAILYVEVNAETIERIEHIVDCIKQQKLSCNVGKVLIGEETRRATISPEGKSPLVEVTMCEFANPDIIEKFFAPKLRELGIGKIYKKFVDSFVGSKNMMMLM